MPKPKEIHPLGESQPFINMLLTAPSGWGKTPFSGSTDGVLIASIDPEGTDSAYYAGSSAEEWTIRSKEDWDKLVQWMRKEGCEVYRWFVIDSVTELQKMLMKDRLKTRPAVGKQDPDIADRPDYQKTQIQLVDYVKVVNDLPINVLWTALDSVLTNSDGEDRIYPMIHGGNGDLAKQIRGYMKIIASGEVLDDEEADPTRRMWFIQKEAHMGRDRTGSLGDSQDNLTLARLEKLVAAKRRERAGTPAAAPRKAVKQAAPSTAPTATRRRVPRTTS